MTATSALAAPRGPSVLGRAPRLEERGEAAAPAQLGGSLGIASSSRPARVFQPRSRQPFLCAVLSGERSPAAGAGGRLDLQLHQPLGCKRQHLAHEIGVRVLLHEPEKSHPLAGLVVSPVGSRSGNPNPCRRPAMAAPGQRHQPPTPPRRALPAQVTAMPGTARPHPGQHPPPPRLSTDSVNPPSSRGAAIARQPRTPSASTMISPPQPSGQGTHHGPRSTRNGDEPARGRISRAGRHHHAWSSAVLSAHLISVLERERSATRQQSASRGPRPGGDLRQPAPWPRRG